MTLGTRAMHPHPEANSLLQHCKCNLHWGRNKCDALICQFAFSFHSEIKGNKLTYFTEREGGSLTHFLSKFPLHKTRFAKPSSRVTEMFQATELELNLAKITKCHQCWTIESFCTNNRIQEK